jgi:tRNA (guanine37-N1)-methyltransferase
LIFNVVTLFPDFFKSPLNSGLLGKALENEIIDVNLVDIQEFSEDKFKRCDDYTYGGGAGMVIKAEPLIKAISSVKSNLVVYTSPSGKVFDNKKVKSFLEYKSISIICGRYEGIDQRVIDKYVDCEVSIGDYILSGGEFAALVIIDSISRHIPGFMSNKDSLLEESLEDDLLEYPHYTRPKIIEDMEVPEILLSGNHKEIVKWRNEKRIEKTIKNRPDLYNKYITRKLSGE